MPQTADLSQYQVSVVDFDDDLTVIIVDHINKRMTAWSLINDKWVKANVADATHNGKTDSGSPMPLLSDLPPLPESLFTVITT